MNCKRQLTALLASTVVALPVGLFGGVVNAEQPSIRPLGSDSVNLSGRDFLRSYSSRDKPESERARLYMLGVTDSSEDRVWCDYKHFETATLQEFVYEYFKKLPERRLDERASRLIQEALKTNFPCKGKK
jgi:hypothetical protein